MKFTEEQYQKIVNLQKQQFTKTIISEGHLINEGCFWEVILKTEPTMAKYVHDNDLDFELAAIANPLTREWAHDKFVEKEKKYYWRTKKKNKQGKSLMLFHGAGGVVQMLGPEEPLTESEIKAWGYNPEMFDKEEV